jgi:hypothetical protein
MDPLAAIGLASAIVQFIDSGCNLIARARKIYLSAAGTPSDLSDLETSFSHLQSFTSKLDTTPVVPIPGMPVPADKARERQLAIACQSFITDLSGFLQALKLEGRPGKLESLMLAAKLERKKGQIEKYEKRLENLRADLTFHLLDTLGTLRIT